MSESAPVHLEEYRAIKAEQTARIGIRENFIFATLTVIAVVGYAALTSGWPDLVLAGAAGVTQIGWVFLSNDRKIAWARNYLRRFLRFRVAAAAGDMPMNAVFAWESQPAYWGLRFWRLAGLWFDLGLFVVPTTAAEVWWILNRWDGSPTNPLLWAWCGVAVSVVLVAIATVASTMVRRPTDSTPVATR